MAIDPSIVITSDVKKTLDYLQKKGKLDKSFDLLKKEHGGNNTFNQVDIQSFRQMSVDVHKEPHNEGIFPPTGSLYDANSTPGAITEKINYFIDRKII
jgi:hypothetical protein